jgi:hypothetical protein
MLRYRCTGSHCIFLALLVDIGGRAKGVSDAWDVKCKLNGTRRQPPRARGGPG